MARFQDIRGRMEAVTRDALAAAGVVNLSFDNVEESPEELPSASISLSFTGTISHSLGCDADLIQGSIIVTIATPKQQGSVAGEDAAQQVLQAWSRLNQDFAEPVRLRTRNHTGPITVPPGVTAHHLHTLNCGFTATVFGDHEPLPALPFLATSEDGRILATSEDGRILVAL